MQKVTIAGIFSLVVINGLFFPAFAFAASQFMVTWEADSYVPGWYSGKALPTRNSLIRVAFELIDNGKPVNLSKSIVRWYVNDELVRNEAHGLGITAYQFKTSDYPGNETEVRISIPNYKGSSVDKILRIPVAHPEVIIQGGRMDGTLGRGETMFRGFPFFFNIRNLSNLRFAWTAANQGSEGSEDSPWDFSLSIPESVPLGTPIEIGLTAQNNASPLEMGNISKTMMVR